MKIIFFIQRTIFTVLLSVISILPQGKVYLVIGSDTAIWDGMSVSKFNNSYNLSLFTAEGTNTSIIMSDAFRNQIIDSYGSPLKMTWWMMAGNIFRYATNNNVPVNNIMTLHLMKKYFGEKIQQWGDELTLHYHTFNWTDYDNDGIYWWNQAFSFTETKDDFDFTLAQFLLDENIFPVSFRSGWHYMDNAWQNYLNEILPFSLHNDWPASRFTTEEPIDNNYDWSLASSEFIPFNPAPDNYQLQGESSGWNVRSKYLGYVNQQLLENIFMKASQGTDQIACFWSHLPDQNFINEIQQFNNLIQQVSSGYPDIQFKYCTAVEAYQLWLESQDEISPDVQLTELPSGSEVRFQIITDEPIFQKQPFIAVKDRYERYVVADCESVAVNTWRTIQSFPTDNIAKAGVALTDTAGNLTTEFRVYLPDNRFIDNTDQDYEEIYGNWTTSGNAAWGTDSRMSLLSPGDSSKARWHLETGFTGLHNIFVQFPFSDNHIDSIKFILYENEQIQDSVILNLSDNFNKWNFLLTADLVTGANNFIEMTAVNNSQSEKVIYADVIKLTAYVRDRQLLTGTGFINLGEISIEDTAQTELELTNAGISALEIQNLYSVNGSVMTSSSLPLILTGMSKEDIAISFIPEELGPVEDTLVIESNDPVNPVYRIPVSALVVNYFLIVDNDDPIAYAESGSWFTSVAQAYGPSSRYAFIQSTPDGPYAEFSFTLQKTGLYDIFEIIPATVNSADNALYKISADGVVIDSFYLNQNEGSGSWKNIGEYLLQADIPISIRVIDSGESSSGPVIRADAFKMALIQETTDLGESELFNSPDDYFLFQNYPNPFNPSTLITYQIPVDGNVTIKIFDVLGEEISVIVDEHKTAGKYSEIFTAESLSSGIYFYKITAGNFSQTKKMVYIK